MRVVANYNAVVQSRRNPILLLHCRPCLLRAFYLTRLIKEQSTNSRRNGLASPRLRQLRSSHAEPCQTCLALRDADHMDIGLVDYDVNDMQETMRDQHA
jgi:hypothetical protein